MKGAVRRVGEDGRRYAIWLTPADYVSIVSKGETSADLEYVAVPAAIFREMAAEFTSKAAP